MSEQQAGASTPLAKVDVSRIPANQAIDGQQSDEVQDRGADTSLQKPKRIGLTILAVVFGGFGLWAVLAPLEGAAIAAGTVAVKSHRKTVQHFEGGIVSEILVRSGDSVEAGDVLLVMDDTQPLAQLEILNGQYLALLASESRLKAERDGLKSVSFPADLAENDEPRATEEIASQTEIFNARTTAREGGVAVLEQRIEQLQKRVDGLVAVRAAKIELVESYAQEVKDFSDLLEEGFADKVRLRDLERNYARLKGEVAELVSSISATEIQIGETRLQILQEDKEFRTAVVDELAKTQTALNDVRERINVLEDTVSRTLVRAPVPGIVMGFDVHTVGAVISSGSPIADIVPQSEELVIDARVLPIDIDRVHIGQEAMIRFSSFARRTVPVIPGTLTSLSADAVMDEMTGMSYYDARIAVTPEGLEQLHGFDLELVPGMPASAHIATGSRTLFQYLTKPFTNALSRSFTED